MAPRVKHTVDGASALRQTVLSLKKPQPSVTTSRMGITTFIQTVLRNNVRFQPRRVKSSGTRSGVALAHGRAAHRLVETFCKTGKLPPRWQRNNVAKWVTGSKCFFRPAPNPFFFIPKPRPTLRRTYPVLLLPKF